MPNASRISQSLVLLILGALLAQLLLFALRLEVDFFDTYEIFQNAKVLARLQPHIEFRRSLLSGVMNVPLALIDSALPGFFFRASHVLALFYCSLFLFITFRIFRQSFDSATSVFGILFLALNPVIIHYSIFAKEDIPAALLVALSVYFLQTNRLGLSGFFAGLSMLLRYNLIALVVPTLAVAGLFYHRREPARIIRCLILLPLLLFTLVPSVIYPGIGRTAHTEGFFYFLKELALQHENHKSVYQSPLCNYFFMLRAFGAPLLLIGLWGMLYAFRHKRKFAALHLLWIALFFLGQTYLMDGKEVRYLLPLFVPLAFFVTEGALSLFTLSGKGASAARILVVGISGLYAFTGLSELQKFSDPFYREPMARSAAQYAVHLAGDSGRILWAGNFFPTHPTDYLFHPKDNYAYVYHVYEHVIAFHARRPLGQLRGGKVTIAGDFSHATLAGAEPFLRVGDVIVASPAPPHTATMQLPSQPMALFVQRVGSVNPMRWEGVRKFSQSLSRHFPSQ